MILNLNLKALSWSKTYKPIAYKPKYKAHEEMPNRKNGTKAIALAIYPTFMIKTTESKQRQIPLKKYKYFKSRIFLFLLSFAICLNYIRAHVQKSIKNRMVI